MSLVPVAGNQHHHHHHHRRHGNNNQGWLSWWQRNRRNNSNAQRRTVEGGGTLHHHHRRTLLPLPNHEFLHFLGVQTAGERYKLHTQWTDNEVETWCWIAAKHHVDEWGDYPLHRAARSCGTACIVRTIFNLYPTAAAMANGGAGNLPLHVALLANNQPAAYLLLAAHPGAVHAMNVHQGLPLHTAIAAACSSRLVKAIWQAYPQAMATPNLNGGQTPLHMVYQRSRTFQPPHGTLSWWICIIAASTTAAALAGSRRRDKRATLLEASLQQAVVTRNARGRLPLHVAVAQEGIAASEVVSLLRFMTSSPAANNAKATDILDHHGNHPLHLACQNCGSNRWHLTMVQALVDYHPQAVRLRNHEGHLPLHVALQHGASVQVLSFLLEHQQQTQVHDDYSATGDTNDPSSGIRKDDDLFGWAVQHDAPLSIVYLLLSRAPTEAMAQWSAVLLI